MAYDPAVIRAIKRIGRRRGESRRYILGGLDTGIVESGLRDLPGGDADSYGFRQQRSSIYGHDNLRRQINNLYDEMHQHDKGQSLGALLADVQRPAAQYRGRYADALDKARALMHGGGGSPIAPQTIGADTGSAIANPIASIASMYNHDPNNPYADTMQKGWDQLSQLWQQKFGQTKQVESGAPSDVGSMQDSSGSPGLQGILHQANKIENAGVPYLWGGGHQSKIAPGAKVTPMDCSGSVSRVLGLDPRVASDFEGWGKSGRGKHVTVWASDSHVLMEINGHFWGTSGSNPGGGAGWISRDQISKDYLKRFVARHPPGM